MEKISLRFDGREASEGRLHFYEYSRSQYATARFITTIEHFRQTGKVAQRVTSATYVEILVQTPQKGSFLEILLVKAQETAATAISAPLASMISLVWQTLLPRGKKTEDQIVELARIRLAEERERTAQEQSRADLIASLIKIVEEENATTREALALAREAMQSNNRALDRAGLSQRRLLEMIAELEQEEARQLEINDGRRALEAIRPEDLAKLTSRLRPMLPEMALPLNKSASTLVIEGGQKSKPLILLNPENVRELVEKQLDEETTDFVVHVKSYDRDRGVGKVSSHDLPRQLNFSVSPVLQLELLHKILEAMAKEQVVFTCRVFRDRSGEITSLVLEDVQDIQ